MTKAFSDIDVDSLNALLKRLEDAKTCHLALESEDYEVLSNALVTLAGMQEHLHERGITIHKLRKLLGIERASEKLSHLKMDNPEATGGDESHDKKPRKAKSLKRKTAKHKGDEPTVKPEVVIHPLTSLGKGDQCPECGMGKVYKYDPGSLLRITGLSPFKAEQHVLEKLRCNGCGAFFTAPLPAEVLRDGSETQKYGYSARALMAIHKHYAGLPFHRQGSLQKLLGVPVSASTIFDQVEYVSNDIYPVYKVIVELAGNAVAFDIDDTHNRILDQTSVEKKARHGNKMRTRTGIYTSGLIATTADGQQLVLFETNIGHAGELIDSVLEHRSASAGVPVVMSDALSGYKPTVTESITALCNAHARRQFVDVISHFPDEVLDVIESYGVIWANTSGLMATTADGQQLVLFETNIGHAGELIDSVLEHRSGIIWITAKH